MKYWMTSSESSSTDSARNSKRGGCPVAARFALPTNADTVLERLYLIPFGRASVLFVVVAGLVLELLDHREGLR
mgnify:CR=1 FL=1